MARVEWVTNNRDGLVWARRVGQRLLGLIVFHTLRGHNRASFWRACRGNPKDPGSWKSCFTLQEARDWVEVEPKEEETHV